MNEYPRTLPRLENIEMGRDGDLRTLHFTPSRGRRIIELLNAKAARTLGVISGPTI